MPISPPDDAPTQRNATAGSRIGVTILFLILLAFGILFTALVLYGFKAAFAQRSWPTVDCVITKSQILDNQQPSNPNYRLDVAFTYTVASQPFTATRLRTDYSGTKDYYDAEKLRDAFPAGAHTTAWYDPSHPQTAVLQPSSLLIGLVVFIPLIFVAIGIGGLYFTWFSNRLNGSPSPRRSKRKPGKMFFSIFFLAGASFLIFFFVPLIIRGLHARSWPQIPCTIAHSGISSHSGNKGGTTYSIEVLYRYQFEGKNYASSKYGFMTGGSSDYYGKQDIVRSLPARKKTICYVDPTDPAYAVLDRSYGSILLFALIPIAFLIIGAAGLLSASRTKAATAMTAAPNSIPGSMIGDVEPFGDLGAKQRPRSPVQNLLVAVCFALFLNGIVSVFVNQLIVEWKHGQHDYFLAVFLVPFVIVCVLLLVYVGYCIVKCFHRSSD